MATLVTSAGDAIATNRMRGGGTEPLYLAIGTGAGTTAKADTTLFTEDYTQQNDGTHNQRVTGTSSQQTNTYTNDTWQCVATVTAAHATAVTNAGYFDTNGQAANLTTAPSGGNLFCKGDFSTVNLNSSDTLQITAKVTFN